MRFALVRAEQHKSKGDRYAYGESDDDTSRPLHVAKDGGFQRGYIILSSDAFGMIRWW